jgi:hypothetical protein
MKDLSRDSDGTSFPNPTTLQDIKNKNVIWIKNDFFQIFNLNLYFLGRFLPVLDGSGRIRPPPSSKHDHYDHEIVFICS